MKNFARIELCEKRLLFSAVHPLVHSPPTGITNTDRQAIINEWQRGHEKNRLQAALSAGGAQFDSELLTYMSAQFNANSHYFFQPSAVAADIRLIQDPTDTYGQPFKRSWQSLMNNAGLEIQHIFSGVQLGSTIDWIDNPKQFGANTSFIDTLNGMGQLVDFATAYRLQPMQGYADPGNAKWVTEIQSELVSWSQQEPPLANPDDYHNTFPRWWLEDTSARALNLEETYALLIGTPAFSPVLNTLFMKEFFLHGDFLSRVTPKGPTSNWDVSQGAALDELSLMFPEFAGAGTWHAVAINNLLVPSLQHQFFADGGQVEQSPTYAKAVLGYFGDVYYLDQGSLPANARQIIVNAANAYYQELEPDGTQPVLGDAVPAISSDVLGPVQLELGITTWSQARLRMPGVFKLGAAAMIGTLSDPANPVLAGRAQDVALASSGNYILRSSDNNANSRELVFQAGAIAPPNDAHAHFDLFSFDLYGFGQRLIGNPGVDNYVPSPERTRLISTPAANTISINGLNHAWVTPANAASKISIKQWSSNADGGVQITAQHTAYQGVSGVHGNPVLTRSIWYDNANTFLVVDWANATASNKYTVAYNLVGPTTAAPHGGLTSTNANGKNVMVVPVLQPGQGTRKTATTIFNGGPTAATLYSVSQTAATALFASVIVTYQGSTPPNVTAQWARLPGRKPGILNILTNGVVTRSVSFSPSGPPMSPSDVPRPQLFQRPPAAIWSSTPIDNLFAGIDGLI